MIDELSRLWWIFSIRGLLALTFSYVCYLLSSSMSTLVLRPAGFVSMQVIFSFYIVASGFVMLTGGLYAYDARLKHRRLLVLNSLCGIGFGFFLFATLALSMARINALFGLHALVVGCFYVAIAIRMHEDRACALVLGSAGAASAFAGVLFILGRHAEMIRMVGGIAAYSAVFGLLLLALSVLLRSTHIRGPLIPS